MQAEYNGKPVLSGGEPKDGYNDSTQMASNRTPEFYARFASGEMWVLGDSPVVGLMLNCQPYDREVIGAPYINDDSTYTMFRLHI